jgi:3-dehydroquinate dehydratase-2
MAEILVINGPNLNLLGSREPDVYGSETLTDIEIRVRKLVESRGKSLLFFQSNHEGAIVDRIHQAKTETVQYIVINPAAFTHTSVAIRDALLAVSIPFIEVHLSNVYKREPFRHHSYLSDVAIGVICGLGSLGYDLAIEAALRHCN